MRKLILTLAILIAVYIGGTVFFFNLMNSQSTTSAEEITDPVLPVLCIDVDGKKINRMYGNIEEMDLLSIRDSIIPMTTEREITVSYRAYGNDVRSVSYEVYAPDTGEAIENAKIGDFRDDGDSKSATFSLNEPILMDREYPIKFTVKTSDREIYYYSRIIQRAHLATSRFVEFVYNFYEMSLNKQASSDLNAYIEPDETIKNTNFANVDIHSSLEMISWGRLNPKLVRKAVPVIREINQETATLTCDYIISAENQSGIEETYHVNEYYRLRYYNSRIMLLNFQRKTLQQFTGNSQVTSSGVNLGISTRSVQYVSDPSSGIVAFVQDNSLWEFNSLTSKLSRIFTFHSDKDDADERDDNDHYGIKIMSVGENGDVNFVVYGYMNKGKYEGRTGVAVCRYSGERTDVQIRAFIPFNGSSETLEKYVDKLSYLNSDGEYYLYLKDNVIRVTTGNGNTANIVKGIMPDCFVVSKDNSKIAWMDEMEPCASKSISVMDLESGDVRKVESGKGEYIRALGFINDDFIYGIAAAEDIKENPAGDKVFAMKTVMITSFDGSQVKDYTPEGMWIKDVKIEEGLIELNRIKKAGDAYVDATSDDIMNNRQTEESLVTTDAKYTNKKGTVISLVFPKSIKNISPLISYGKIRDAGKDATVAMPALIPAPCRLYRVYGRGKLDSILTDPAKAVRLADDLVGTAVDEKGRYLYERGNTDSKNELINEYIPAVFLSGLINSEALAEGCGEDQDVVNLTGCTLQQVLYRVSQGNAVAAMKNDGSVTVIVGYDRYNTLLYNFDTGEHYYYGINDSTAMFEKAGNVFVTYLENTKTIRDEE